jgi:hypothetical protein
VLGETGTGKGERGLEREGVPLKEDTPAAAVVADACPIAAPCGREDPPKGRELPAADIDTE